MAASEFTHLKNKTVTTKDGEMTHDTDILDGEAKDSAVFNEDNPTIQYKTPPLKIGDVGGRNDPNG
jgi:hypothetical protein